MILILYCWFQFLFCAKVIMKTKKVSLRIGWIPLCWHPTKQNHLWNYEVHTNMRRYFPVEAKICTISSRHSLRRKTEKAIQKLISLTNLIWWCIWLRLKILSWHIFVEISSHKLSFSFLRGYRIPILIYISHYGVGFFSQSTNRLI